MNAIARPLITTFHLPRWSKPLPFGTAHRRRRTTIDLIHSSPHLLRDIGATEDHFSERRQ